MSSSVRVLVRHNSLLLITLPCNPGLSIYASSSPSSVMRLHSQVGSQMYPVPQASPVSRRCCCEQQHFHSHSCKDNLLQESDGLKISSCWKIRMVVQCPPKRRHTILLLVLTLTTELIAIGTVKSHSYTHTLRHVYEASQELIAFGLSRDAI